MISAPSRSGLVVAACILAAACSSGASSDVGSPEGSAAASTTISDSPTTSGPAADPTTTPSVEPTVAPTTAPGTPTTIPTTTPSTTPGSTTNPPPSTTPPTTGLSAEQLADMELARTALIGLDVFPEGWTEAPDVDDTDVDVAFEQRFDDCLGRTGDSITDQLDDVEAESGDFTGPGDNPPSVQHSVTLAPDESTAVQAMSELALEGADDCLEDVVQDFFEQQLADDPDVPAELRIGEVRIDRVETGEPADVSIAYIIEIPLELGEQRGAQYLELLFHRRGRALSSLEFSSFGSPFDRDGYQLLGDEAAVRIAAIGS